MTVERSGDPAGDRANLLNRIGTVRDRRGTVEVSCRSQCHSGGTFSGRWRGVRLADLLADVDPETTHVRAVSADGYYAPISVVEALDAVVATERLDADPGGLPRIVGGPLDSSQTVQALERIEPIAIPADGDPEPGHLDGREATTDGDETTEDPG